MKCGDSLLETRSSLTIQTVRTSSIDIRVVRSFAGIEDIRHIWEPWQHHPNSDIDFYLTILKSRPEIQRPHILVLYRNGIPDAMLIGRLERKQIEFKMGYKSLVKAQALMLTFPYEGLLGTNSLNNCTALVEQVMTSLKKNEADLALFEPLRVDSAAYTCAKRMPGLLSRSHLASPQPHWRIKLPLSFDEFLRRLPTKIRRNRKQEENKLWREFPGGVRIDCLFDVADVDRVVDHAETIAKTTYHRGLGVGFISNDENRHRLRLNAKNGRLRAYILYLGSQPCAFMIATVYGTVAYCEFMGHDPAYSKLSPGTFLLLRMVEDLCGSNTAEIDFGFGDAWYKRQFCDCSWSEASVQLFAPTLKGIRLNILQTATSLANQAGKKALQRSELIPKLKRLWRNRLAPRYIRRSIDSQ